MSGNKIKMTVVLVAVVILAVEGLLVYRFYQGSSSTTSSPDNGGVAGAFSNSSPDSSAGSMGLEATTPETTTQEETPDGSLVEAAFVHRATPENSQGDYTYVNNPSSNGDPDAVLLVTAILNEEDSGNRNLGVWYEPNRQRWAIFNQDLTAVPAGTTFSVIVLKSPENAAVHRATPGNTDANSTLLDHPRANGTPEAILMVTPNWNPGGGGGIYNDHPVGVGYDPDAKRWAVFNKDLAPIPNGAAFNVAVWETG